ncbi:MAG TPA: carboxypeptidase regulatory-like domain-containing protein [Thermoanaerobaculia bacterium]|nr:carboxypeptidase regulatory-like domain-containing protein [Thermoanaerobaculia bacterium]
MKRPLFIALPALCAVVALAQSWTGVGRLSGVVVAPDGKPVAKARVSLHFERPDGAGPATESDARGRWSALGLAPGLWHAEVEAEGYLRADGQAQVPGEGPGPQLRFELRPLGSIAPSARQTDRSVVLGWIEEGNRLLAAGKRAEARAAWERALPELPPDGQAPVLRAIARAWFEEGRRAEAVVALERAIAADRYDAESARLLELLTTEDQTGGEAPPVAAAPPPQTAPSPEASPPPSPAVAHRTGIFSATLPERSPRSELGELLRRTGVSRREIEADPNGGRYDLAHESFSLVVPETYRPEVPHGLLVWVSPSPIGGASRPDLLRELALRRLIWVGANDAGNERPRWYRFALALDAAHNLAKLYRIDPERIYIAGYSGGGRVSSVLSVAYPEVFRGGLLMVGCDWFRPLPIPDRPGTSWPALYPKPAKQDLDLAKSRNRYVFLTAERDFNRIQTREVFHAFEREGFAHTAYIEVPGIGHYGPVPTPDWVRAFDALDPAGAALVKASSSPVP